MISTTLNPPRLFADRPDDLDWTFRKANTREMTHCYHDYPARMVPQIARQILTIYGSNGSGLVLDPYCGTGTTLLESLVAGYNAIGFDLNPVARMIAQAKTTLIQPSVIDEAIERFGATIHRQNNGDLPDEILGISRLDYWFKPDVVKQLAEIRWFVSKLNNGPIKLFFQTAFSETVRDSSNTRTHEFKLYRYNASTLENFRPDAYSIMLSKLRRNREGLSQLIDAIGKTELSNTVSVVDFDSVDTLWQSTEPVDFIITSPPYGDSNTTVAYGQYSRLSAAWLGFEDAAHIDKKLMGSRKATSVEIFGCKPLDESIEKVKLSDAKRAAEVSAFYCDLRDSISNICGSVRRGGYSCYVVGNRKVKGVVLPTDKAVQHFFEANGYSHEKTFNRGIPNKRMPSRNSPSNIIGVTHETMTKEYIVVMRKI